MICHKHSTPQDPRSLRSNDFIEPHCSCYKVYLGATIVYDLGLSGACFANKFGSYGIWHLAVWHLPVPLPLVSRGQVAFLNSVFTSLALIPDYT